MTQPGPGEPVDLIAWKLATKLRTCLCAELAQSLAGKPGRCGVLPGRDVAADDCCDGQAWVRVVRVFRSNPDDFPNATGTAIERGCDDTGYWAVDFGVGVMRCVPTLDDQGEPPTVEQLEQAAMEQADDRARSLRAIRCCFLDTAGVKDIALGEWLPIGPQGDCVAGEWVFSALVQVGELCCADDEEGEQGPGLRAPWLME